MTGPLYWTSTGSTTSRAAQDRSSNPANVLDYGADPTGATDSTTALSAAIATGSNVYIPRGNYIVRNQLTTQATAQEIFGDGLATVLLIDQTFNPAATCVFSLVGREYQSPTIRDLRIMFAQPSDQNSRDNFRTLAAGGTSGTGGTGIKYPPAIGITNSNRFKLRNLKISRAWDGIMNMGTNTIGGFFIRDIEMCAFDVGLSLNNVFDFGHCVGYHMWSFDLSTALQQGVWWDGNTFAAKFGVDSNGAASDYGGGVYTDFCCYDSRVQIMGAHSFLTFFAPNMDGLNSTMEVSNSQYVQLFGGYFTGSPQGANPNTAQLNVSGGNVFVSNLYWQTGGGSQAINFSGGKLWINGGEIAQASNNTTAIVQSGGRSYIAGTTIAPAVSAAWTVPLVSVTGGLISFHANSVVNQTVGDVGALVIATDSAQNSVGGNFWNGWGFTPPGALGDYGFNSPQANYGQQLILGKTGQAGRLDLRRGSDGAATAWVGFSNASGSSNTVDLTSTSGSSQVRLNGNLADVFLVNGVECGRVDAQGMSISQRTGSATAPGATVGRLTILPGTNAGTAKLVVYAGTSTTPVTIVDNIGAGF